MAILPADSAVGTLVAQPARWRSQRASLPRRPTLGDPNTVIEFHRDRTTDRRSLYIGSERRGLYVALYRKPFTSGGRWFEVQKWQVWVGRLQVAL